MEISDSLFKAMPRYGKTMVSCICLLPWHFFLVTLHFLSFLLCEMKLSRGQTDRPEVLNDATTFLS